MQSQWHFLPTRCSMQLHWNCIYMYMLCQCKRGYTILESNKLKSEWKLPSKFDGCIFVSRLCVANLKTLYDNVRRIIPFSAANFYFWKGTKLAVRMQGSTTIHDSVYPWCSEHVWSRVVQYFSPLSFQFNTTECASFLGYLGRKGLVIWSDVLL